MKHDIILEERFFSADITALRTYDSGFNQAWQDGSEYELEIMLPELFGICPRKYARTLMYSRLVNFLKEKNITLNVVSRKNNNPKTKVK